MGLNRFLRQIGKNIKTARQNAGLKQIDVHVRTGLTYRHYQSIEAGRVNITVETLFRLSRLFKVPAHELVHDASV